MALRRDIPERATNVRLREGGHVRVRERNGPGAKPERRRAQPGHAWCALVWERRGG